jgi:FixJ family two-component response regulator
MSGLTLAHLLSVQRPGAPVLFISGFPESHGEEPPASRWAFLSKPFGSQQLLPAVEQILGVRPSSSPPAS